MLSIQPFWVALYFINLAKTIELGAEVIPLPSLLFLPLLGLGAGLVLSPLSVSETIGLCKHV